MGEELVEGKGEVGRGRSRGWTVKSRFCLGGTWGWGE